MVLPPNLTNTSTSHSQSTQADNSHLAKNFDSMLENLSTIETDTLLLMAKLSRKRRKRDLILSTVHRSFIGLKRMGQELKEKIDRLSRTFKSFKTNQADKVINEYQQLMTEYELFLEMNRRVRQRWMQLN